MHPEYLRPDLSETLTGTERVALVRIMEEAAELAKEAAKALRFGLHNRHPVGGSTNLEKIKAESADLLNAVDSLVFNHTPAKGGA